MRTFIVAFGIPVILTVLKHYGDYDAIHKHGLDDPLLLGLLIGLACALDLSEVYRNITKK